MEFLLLGPLEVRDGERLVPLGGTKQRAVLALLLLRPNEVVSRDRLVDALWDGRPPASSGHTVETYISRLRRALRTADGTAEIVTRPPGYMLRIDAESVDVARFVRLAADGRTALAEGRAVEASERLRAALGLFRGPPLHDVAFLPFAGPEAHRLEELRLSVLEDRIAADLASGHSDDLVAELSALVDAHPLREKLSVQLALALYRAGRQADALEALRAARRRLADGLGVDAGSPVDRLETAILRHDKALDTPRVDRPREEVATGTVRPPAIGPRPDVPPPRGKASGRRTDRLRATPARPTLVVLALALVVAALAGLRDRSPNAKPTPATGSRVVIVDARRGTVTGGVALAAPPGRIAAGFGSVWVSEYSNDAVARIVGHAVRQTIAVGNGPAAITTGDGAVWVADTLDGRVSRVDPETDRVVQTISVGDGPSGIAYGNRMVWVAVSADRQVVGIDARTGQVVARVGLGTGVTDVAVGADAVWATGEAAGVVDRISLSDHNVSEIRVGTGPTAITSAGDTLWVTNTLDGTVSRIDPARDVVTATVQVGDGPAGLAFAGGTLWVANEYSGTLTRIDPTVPVVTRTIPVGTNAVGVAVTQGRVWVGVRGDGTAHRGGTLRVVAAISRLDSIDPGMAFMLLPPQLLGMTNDGLVTLKHVAGTEGTQLEPDLALALPMPGNGGLSYTFRIRPGVRYSTGQMVRPEDFRRAIERDFVMGSPGAPFYTAIAGADACAPSTRCDLTTGIATNDVDSTVTFHLVRPDPEFLDKLTLTFAFAVPAGTPDRDIGTHPIAATGPYLIEKYVPGRLLSLVRNPSFHEWSRAAQPDGYPDRIEWQFGLGAEAAVTAVEHGRADWGLYEFPFSPPGDRLQELQTQYAAQTHVNALPETEFFALNTRTPPFNDVRVRRALNFAIDRNILVSLYGGSELARPTCQILPPGVPGYRRYCPYALQARPDGTYTGPNLPLARRLVADSHTRGMRVQVLTDPDFAPANYIAKVLRSLGYHASVRTPAEADLNRLTNNSRYQVQISRGGWVADYPAASEFLNHFLSCRAFQPNSDANTNVAEFCNPTVDQVISRALQLQDRRPSDADRAWAEADRATTDQAPWLPTVNLNAVDLLSDRVGDYQFHPQWGILLDQLWVTP